jgi:hypothetical protein
MGGVHAHVQNCPLLLLLVVLLMLLLARALS